MGIGFTIDTPFKVAQYGMDSVISLVDDILLEKLRKMYSDKFEIPYKEITNKIDDFRAKRITSYLNLISDLAEKKFDDLKNIPMLINTSFNVRGEPIVCTPLDAYKCFMGTDMDILII